MEQRKSGKPTLRIRDHNISFNNEAMRTLKLYDLFGVNIWNENGELRLSTENWEHEVHIRQSGGGFKNKELCRNLDLEGLYFLEDTPTTDIFKLVKEEY